jgi:hypothetical protein
MILHRGIVPATLVAAALFVACIPENTRLARPDGAAPTGGSTGTNTGGSGEGTGGSTGGSAGGSTGGSGGSAYGTGGATGGSTGGSVDSGAPGSKDAGAMAVDSGGIKLDDINLNVLANCVFCHPGMAQKQSDFDPSDKGLYDRLLTTMDKAIPATCPIKTLISPGKPEMSLIYLKVTGTQPAACGMRMPLAPDMKKPGTPLDAASIKMLKDWITAGAPQ